MQPSEMVRRNVGVAAGTALSRLTGLARVVMIGVVFGGGELADAYVSANSAPNSVYELLLGGVLSAGLVPVFTDLRVKDDRDGINAILTVGLVASFVVAAVAVLAAPLIFRVLTINAATGIDVAAFRDAGTALARILLVQVLFYGMIAFGSALLQSRRRFQAAAWSPVLANVVTVAGLVVLLVIRPADGWRIEQVEVDRTLRWILGGGATLGIAVSAVAIVLAARRTDHGFAWRFAPRDPAVTTLVRLSLWTFGYVASNQIALVVVQNLTEPGSGGRFAYAQAYTFFVLPHGLLAVSIATTFAPELAEAVARRSAAGFARVLATGIRFTALLTVPSAIGIFVLRRPIVGVFLQHGALEAGAVDLVADTLGAFALGLPAFSLYLFVLRGFYARLDTRTPFLVNAFECALNIVVGVLLVGRFGVPGLAASFAIAYGVSAVVAAVLLLRESSEFETRRTLRSLGVTTASAAAMGGVVWLAATNVGGDAGVGAAVRVAVGVAVGVAAYVAVLTAVGDDDVSALTRIVLRRSSSGTGASPHGER